jgi:hypothetical protein
MKTLNILFNIILFILFFQREIIAQTEVTQTIQIRLVLN